jgi:hypothetical protein
MPSNLPIESKLLNGNGKKSADHAKNPENTANGDKSQKKLFTTEKVADLPSSFNLSRALEKAYDKAVKYMNDMLDSRDLEVNIIEAEDLQIGQVTNKLTGEKISSYDGKEMLRLYAHNHQIKGIVVDGKI